MKRFKKVWIVCAALAVVVALCAFALLNRPVPYRFLEGSHYEKTEIVPILLEEHDVAMREYRVQGSLDAVAERAIAELRPADGWQHERARNYVHITNSNQEDLLTLTCLSPQERQDGGLPARSDTVWVYIVRPATPMDRFLVWMQSL